MTPTVGFCVHRYRPASRSARRPLASSPSWRRKRTTTPQCMTMPGCRTCSALPWNGIALHGGPLPGYAASHGCVRMPYGFAEKLFDKTRIGMRVIIAPNDAAPVEFSHTALFMPNAEAIAAAPARAETLAREAAEAVKAADEAKKAVATTVRETALLTASLRKLESLKRSADAALASADKALASAKTDQAKARAEDRKQKAAAKAAELGTQLDTARADAKSKLDAAAAAKDAAKAAETKKAATAKAATEGKLALEPVSIYISRATQKLYVRRNTHKPWPDGGEVFDATIEAVSYTHLRAHETVLDL